MNKIHLPLLLIFLTLQIEGQVIAPSDPGITTHTLVSGNVTLGISSAGGGYMNMLVLPGKGDIMDAVTDMYGRGGQSAMRDGLRSGKYNPTQAGFNETLGTPSDIVITRDSLVISPRMCALWHGDGQYDYTRWENIGADPYKDDFGNSDTDGIEEEYLVGKQLTEVGSEFDYYGVYENYMGRDGLSIPCFRHYYEYRLIREPGHCLSQFGPGTSVYNSNQLVPDISTQYPEGIHQAGESDISNLIKVWSLRSEFYILVGTPNEIYESANKIEELTLRPQPVDQWNFDTDLEGWTLTKNLTGYVKDSILSLRIEGADPFMTSASGLKIYAENRKVVEVKMKQIPLQAGFTG